MATDNVGNVEPAPPSPEATSLVLATFTVGVADSFTVTTAAYVPAVLTETGTLPQGVTFVDNGDGTATLSGTPAATSGEYIFDITATTPDFPPVTQTFALAVIDPPSITSATGATFTVGQAASFAITTTPGVPAMTTLSESGKLPGGVTFKPGSNGTATLSGTPAAGSGGVYHFTISAGNAALSETTQAFTLTVNQVGQAPSLPATGTATFTEGVMDSDTITATPGSPAKTTLALAKGTTLPKGLTFKNNGNNTATLSGTPAAKTGGSYSFGVTASNAAGLMATETFTLLIDQAPAITSAASATFTAGTAGSFTVTTTGYQAAAFSEKGALPAGVSLVDNQNGTAAIIGTPTSMAAGVYTFTVNATNSVSTATHIFTLTVDQPPIITSMNTASFTIGQADSFTVATAGFPTATLSESGKLPKGVAFKTGSKGTATLSGTPAAGTGGTYLFTITAGNGVAPESFQLFTLTVAAESGSNIVTATIGSPAVNSPPSTTVATAASPAAAPSLGTTSTNGRATDAALRALLLDESAAMGKPRSLFEL